MYYKNMNGFMHMKKVGRMKNALIIEIIYKAVHIIKCFGTCTEFIVCIMGLSPST